MIQESVGCLWSNVEKQVPISTDNILSFRSKSCSTFQFPPVNSSHSPLEHATGGMTSQMQEFDVTF